MTRKKGKKKTNTDQETSQGELVNSTISKDDASPNKSQDSDDEADIIDLENKFRSLSLSDKKSDNNSLENKFRLLSLSDKKINKENETNSRNETIKENNQTSNSNQTNKENETTKENETNNNNQTSKENEPSKKKKKARKKKKKNKNAPQLPLPPDSDNKIINPKAKTIKSNNFNSKIVKSYMDAIDNTDSHHKRLDLMNALQNSLMAKSIELKIYGSMAYGAYRHSGDIDFLVVFHKEDSVYQNMAYFLAMLKLEKFTKEGFDKISLVGRGDVTALEQNNQLLKCKFVVKRIGSYYVTSFNVDFSFNADYSYETGMLLSQFAYNQGFRVIVTFIKELIFKSNLFGRNNNGLNSVRLAHLIAFFIRQQEPDFQFIDDVDDLSELARKRIAWPHLIRKDLRCDVDSFFVHFVTFLESINVKERAIDLYGNSLISKYSFKKQEVVIMDVFSGENLCPRLTYSVWGKTLELLKKEVNKL